MRRYFSRLSPHGKKDVGHDISSLSFGIPSLIRRRGGSLSYFYRSLVGGGR